MSDTRTSPYLPELDGLRALAISAVLLFHIAPGLLKGGFLGVDIFFVISGFLITRKIAPQIAEGRFSFREFYLGRARRLVPVFLLTLMLTWLAAWWLLFPAELKSLSSTTLAALTGLANYQFARRLDYFSPDLDAQPLLHIWSLAVEEQFYLLYPLLLLILFKRLRFVWFIAGCGLLFILSCFMSQWVPGHAFFSLETRAWELGAGCLVALMARPVWLSPYWDKTLGWLGLALCLGSLTYIHDKTPLPSPAALPVILGTALLILTRCGGLESGLHRTTVLAPIRYLGRISYSLYLLHWPVLVFGQKLALAWGTQEKLLVIIVSLVLTIIAHHLLENPVRRSRSASALKWLAVGGVVAALAMVTLAWHGRVNGGLIGSPAEAALQRVLPEHAEPKPATERWVPMGIARKKPDILLIGDSHAQCLIMALDAALKERQQAGSAWVAHATLPLVGVATSASSETFAREVLPEILRSPARRVVLCASWSSYLIFDPADWKARRRILTPHSSAEEGVHLVQRALGQTLTQLTAAGKEVLLIDPVPGYRQNIPQYLVQHQRLGVPPAQALTTMIDYQKRHQTILKIFEEITANRSGVRRISPLHILLKDGRLIYQEGGLSLYEDNSHLSRLGAGLIVPALSLP